MQLQWNGPFELSCAPTPPESQLCLYCTARRPDDKTLRCSVCKRSNTLDWLKNIQVGYRFILRGTVTNLAGIVIAIHVLQRRVDLLCAAKDGRSVVFKTMEIPATVIENLQSLPSESPWHALFDAYGYCVNCHLTFKVESATTQEDTTSLNNQITRERTILSELIQSKKARKQTKPTSREMVELTASIKRQEKLIWLLTKKREVVPAWCPHCGHSFQAIDK